jgi:hypothetical protein
MKLLAKSLCVLGLAITAGSAHAMVAPPVVEQNWSGSAAAGFDSGLQQVQNSWFSRYNQINVFDFVVHAGGAAATVLNVNFSSLVGYAGGLELEGPSGLSSQSFGNIAAGQNYSFQNLAAGNYRLSFNMEGPAGPGGTYGDLPGSFEVHGTVGAVPEPSTYALMALGLAGIAYMRSRKHSPV